MHSFTWNAGDPDAVTIHHDGDFGGIVLVTGPGVVELAAGGVEIPAEALLTFAGEYVRHMRITELEQADAVNLLSGSR